MDEKKLSTILEALAEKISSLEFELQLRDYDLRKAKEENETLKSAVENLKKALLKEDE